MSTGAGLNKRVVLAKALPQLSKCAVKDTAHLEVGSQYVLLTDFNGLSAKEKKLVTSEKTYEFQEMASEIAISSNAVYFDCITKDSRFKSDLAVFINGDEDIHCVGVREFEKWGVTSIKNVIVPVSVVAFSDYDKIMVDVTSAMVAEINAAAKEEEAKKAVKKTATTKKAVKKTANNKKTAEVEAKA